MKALKRLAYTIQNQNKPNENDVEALNEVIRYYNAERDRLIVNNRLFAKLFLNVLRNDIIRSNGNYQLSIDSLRNVVRISLDDQLSRLITDSNQIFLEKEVKGIENETEMVDYTYPKYDAEKMKVRIKDIIANLIEDYNEFA